MILGFNPGSGLGSLSSKPAVLQRICIILGLNPDFLGGTLFLQTSCFTAYLYDFGTKSRFSFRILILQKKGWDTCIQVYTKASNPQCKIHFGNLTCRILILQTTWFWVFLHDFGTKSRFSFWILILQTSWFTAYLHNFGTKSRFSFGILILQTTWFTANLYDFGTKSRFSFRILILQKKGWDKCLQKPLIHDAKLILEILLFGSWSSKLPGFECFLHDLGTKSRFRFGILILQTRFYSVFAWIWD